MKRKAIEFARKWKKEQIESLLQSYTRDLYTPIYVCIHDFDLLADKLLPVLLAAEVVIQDADNAAGEVGDDAIADLRTALSELKRSE
jgi:hypothetical protein